MVDLRQISEMAPRAMQSRCGGRQLLASDLHNRDRLPVVQISKPASADEHSKIV